MFVECLDAGCWIHDVLGHLLDVLADASYA